MSTEPENWRMIAAVPGIDLPQAVDGGDLAAIGSSDPRYTEILESQTGTKEYLSKFRTPFGRQLRPTIIIAPGRVPEVRADWFFEFRAIVAVCHVIRARVDALTGWVSAPVYSELFDVYPFSLGKDGEHIMIQAAGEKGFHQLSKFEGSYPFTVTADPTHLKAENDDRLCAALLSLWQTRPAGEASRVFRSRIFRSIVMADYALRGLYANLGSQIDAGIPLSLWASAFETLAAPPTGDVKTIHVTALIDKVPWTERKLLLRHYKAAHFTPKPPGPLKVTLPVQIYGRLCSVRNLLLHGRPLPQNLEPDRKKHWGNLGIQVPALYRSTLLYLLSSEGFGGFPTDWWAQAPYEAALCKLEPDI